MKHLFGPVNSRRLGLSMGVDLVPAKICNFNCIYCEVGATTTYTGERLEYVPTAEILAEIDALLAGREGHRQIDVFTVTGSGEPTLHSGLGEVIRYLKEKTGKPVAVLTNGSLLHLPAVRQDLLAADIVVPSLDAARTASFRRVNRPVAGTELEQVIAGIAEFVREFNGEVWLEVLLVSGINDGSADIEALQAAVREIKPTRVQLNTVARPPLESFAAALGRERLEAIAAQLQEGFSGPVDILVDFSRQGPAGSIEAASSDEILQMLKRRPCTAADIREALNLDAGQLETELRQLEQAGRLVVTTHQGKPYYQVPVKKP